MKREPVHKSRAKKYLPEYGYRHTQNLRPHPMWRNYLDEYYELKGELWSANAKIALLENEMETLIVNVTTNSLLGAGTGYPMGAVSQGTVVTVYDERNGWIAIQSNLRKWILRSTCRPASPPPPPPDVEQKLDRKSVV